MGTIMHNDILYGAGVTPEQSDWNETDTTDLAYIKNKPTIPAAQIQSDWAQTTTSSLDFIKNKPTIPIITSTYDPTSDDGMSGVAVASAISGKANTSDLDDWVATASVSSGSVTFSGINDSGNYGYEVFFNITSASTNKNPTAQLDTISGEGTSSMSLTYTTDADNGATCKLRRIK